MRVCLSDECGGPRKGETYIRLMPCRPWPPVFSDRCSRTLGGTVCPFRTRLDRRTLALCRPANVSDLPVCAWMTQNTRAARTPTHSPTEPIGTVGLRKQVTAARSQSRSGEHVPNVVFSRAGSDAAPADIDGQRVGRSSEFPAVASLDVRCSGEGDRRVNGREGRPFVSCRPGFADRVFQPVADGQIGGARQSQLLDALTVSDSQRDDQSGSREGDRSDIAGDFRRFRAFLGRAGGRRIRCHAQQSQRGDDSDSIWA